MTRWKPCVLDAEVTRTPDDEATDPPNRAVPPVSLMGCDPRAGVGAGAGLHLPLGLPNPDLCTLSGSFRVP